MKSLYHVKYIREDCFFFFGGGEEEQHKRLMNILAAASDEDTVMILHAASNCGPSNSDMDVEK